MKRIEYLDRSLLKDTVKKDQIVEFIHKMIENGHAEIAQPLPTGSERWYLPFFGVYHPKKPGKVRVVFDSSAKFAGVSLNDMLLDRISQTDYLGCCYDFVEKR